jgi:hypothetical protein
LITIFLHSRYLAILSGEYHNPLVVEGESFSYDQNAKNIFMLLISIVNDHRKKIGGNFHAEM